MPEPQARAVPVQLHEHEPVVVDVDLVPVAAMIELMQILRLEAATTLETRAVLMDGVGHYRRPDLSSPLVNREPRPHTRALGAPRTFI